VSECPDKKITNDGGLTRSAWHTMPYGCTHMAAVGVKGLKMTLGVKMGIP